MLKYRDCFALSSLTYLNCPGAHVRHQQHVRIAHKTGVNLGLFFEDIQTGRVDLAAVQRIHERVFVNDGTASRVHNHHAVLHLVELRLADDVACVFLFGIRSVSTSESNGAFRPSSALTFNGRFKLITSLVASSSSNDT